MSTPLNKIFEALASEPRRQILAYLSEIELTTSDLAQRFEMSAPAISRHLSVLEKSGVIRSSKDGRVRTCELSPKTLGRAEAWLAGQRAIWEARTDRMSAFAERLHQQELEREPGPQRPRR